MMKRQVEKLSVAIVYDKAVTWGGAEQVLMALLRALPDATLLTSVADVSRAEWVRKFESVETSWMQHIPGKVRWLPFLTPLMPDVFQRFDLSPYDVVISMTSYDAKIVSTRADQLHVCYCLTPNRWLWLNRSMAGYSGFGCLCGLANSFRAWFAPSRRMLDQFAATRPDVMWAISKLVASRIKKFYAREAAVLYPPVSLVPQSFDEHDDGDAGGYYLCVGRLVDYKKVDRVIEAFNGLPYRLKIVGTGSNENYLRSLIRSQRIEMLGFVPDAALRHLMSNARGLIMPQVEDYGITALESLACGRPVVIHHKSGAAELMTDGVHGVLIESDEVSAIVAGVERLQSTEWDQEVCRSLAAQYDDARFVKEFLDRLEAAWIHHVAKFESLL